MRDLIGGSPAVGDHVSVKHSAAVKAGSSRELFGGPLAVGDHVYVKSISMMKEINSAG